MRKLLKTVTRAGALEILFYLRTHKEARFVTFKKMLPDAIIGLRLKELETIGLVEKEKAREYRPKAIYRLTKKGKEVVDVLKRLEEFA